MTNYRVYLCGGPRCSAHNIRALRDQLDTALWEQQLDDRVEVIISGCQDRCDHGPNLTVWPGPHRYAHLTATAIMQIVTEHVGNGEPAQHLLASDDERR